MTLPTFRLAPSTVVEPLLNRWAVWSDVISPGPYSMHLANYQVPTLTSYLQNPDVHLKASRNPKLIGGRFVDIAKERRGEVEALLEETRREHADNIRFAEALTQCYETLSREAKGQSLEPYYTQVPEPLRGYVELLYDYYSNPIVRLIEPLLYRSPYMKRSHQSLRMFRPARDDSRPFFLSTPRLPEEGDVSWHVPFADPAVDDLFSLDRQGRPLGEIAEILGMPADRADALRPFLTEAPLPEQAPWEGEGPRIRYLGHACVLVEWKGVSIMTDPWVGALPTEGGLERITFADLPERIDYALITHGHHDHFVIETLLRLRHRIGTLVVPRSFGLFHADVSLRLAGREIGFKNVVEVDTLDSIPLPDGEIVSVPFFGEHADLAHAKSAYVVRCGKQSILFAADANCIEPQTYAHVQHAIGDVQTVFLGMECVGAPLSWLYGALLPSRLSNAYDKSRRTQGSDAPAAMALLERVNAERVYIYALGGEPWLNYSMGLGLDENSPQVKEANKVLEAAAGVGLRAAARPFGHMEISL
jgi:L-ascorbate metabolism protein UlaG (beta-lactamase superfamily)